MRIFKTRWFERWASKQRLSDRALVEAVREMEQGLVDADLGGNVYKKRIAQGGRGKSASVRTLLAFRLGNHTFYLYGFAKNKRANIAEDELRILKSLARELLAHDDETLEKLLKAKQLFEVLEDE